MRYLTLAVALMFAFVPSGAVYAGDIYKWTDEEGNVHFGDRPDGESSERLAIQSKPTDPARIQAQTQARAEARTKAAEEKAAAAAQGPSPEELQAQAEERAQKCTHYKDKMQKYVTSRRLYREDESGERVYLDDEEMLAAREEVEGKIQEYCGS